MPIPLVDLRAEYATIKHEIDPAVERVISSGRFILGAEVESFESEFAAYCGTRHAVGVSSGTAALQLALEAAGVGPGDEVITTPFTFIATVAAISHVGASPVFVDIDEDTYNIDAHRIESAITGRTRAILPVHLYGQPADMTPILDVAHSHGLTVIEDAAQAHGATYGGRRVGGLGHVACFSFYPAKNLGAYGDAGALVTNDSDIADRVRAVSNHGRTGWYEHAHIGYTYRLDELQAAVLRVKLTHLDEWNSARRLIADGYREALDGTTLILPAEAHGCDSVYHLFVARSDSRDDLAAYMKGVGIATAVHYPIPVHLQPAYSRHGWRLGDFPIAEGCADKVLSLPIYPGMTDGQIEEVASAIRAFEGAR